MKQIILNFRRIYMSKPFHLLTRDLMFIRFLLV